MTGKPQTHKSTFKQFQELMNRRDKEYYQSFIETSIPCFISFVYVVVMIGIFTIIWGDNPPRVPAQLAGTIFFLINSFTGVIIISKKRTTGPFFTVQRGRSAIIVGILWIIFCGLGALASLGLALESL
jgi:hypothetical protein